MAKTDEQLEQAELEGMPARGKLGELCKEFLTRKSKIAGLYEQQDATEDEIIKQMVKDKKPVVKFQDPDTTEWVQFVLSEGITKLSVKKVPKKIAR